METDKLKLEIAALEHQLGLKKERLNRIQNGCKHDWGQTQFVPDYQEAYYIPSDREQGIELGVDSRPGCYVDAENTRIWTRTCRTCGETQTTQRTKKTLSASNVPGCGCEQEVPDFGG